MPYTKNAWVDDSAPDLDATNLNHMETGIASAPYGPDGSSGFVPVGDGSGGWLYQKIDKGQLAAGAVSNTAVDAAAAIARSKLDFGSGLVNADVASAAAIAYSKLSLAGSILNADISSSAAIALSKLAGYPSDATKFARGDGTWAAPVSGTRGVATVVWPGSATLSSGTTVTHSLGSTPTAVVATMNAIGSGVSVICAIQVSSIGATTFGLFAQTIDGSTPVATSSITVSWHAIP